MPVIILYTLNQMEMKKMSFTVALAATAFVQHSFAPRRVIPQPSPLLKSAA